MADTSPTPNDALEPKAGESFGMLTKVAIVVAIIALLMFAVYEVL
jgi:hypothetical protein